MGLGLSEGILVITVQVVNKPHRRGRILQINRGLAQCTGAGAVCRLGCTRPVLIRCLVRREYCS